MKPLKIVLILCVIFTSYNTEAQFLKRLKERTKQSTEETAIMKVEEKTAEKTAEMIDKVFDKTIDNLFNGKKKKGKKRKQSGDDENYSSDEMMEDDENMYEEESEEETGMSNSISQLNDLMNSAQNMGAVDYSNIPKSYDFEWKYVMSIKVEDKEEMQMTYFLQPDTDYMGMEMKMKEKGESVNMFMVIDNQREFGIMLMDVENTKYASVVSTPTNNYDYDLYNEDLGNNFSFKEIGSKTILGYNCNGFRMEDEDSIVTMYMTTDAPVSFNKIFKANDTSAPSGFDPKWLKHAENGVIMEMEFINKSFDNQTTKMYCKEFAQEPLTIKLSEYQMMKSNFMKQ